MKVCVICDTHYGFKKSSQIFQEYFEAFYSTVFFPTLEKENIDTVIHMGDVFDNRRNIDFNALKWSKEVVFEPLSKYDVHMIVGNHDVYYKNTNEINSPELLLNKYKNITHYKSASEIVLDKKTFALIPWINEDNVKETEAFIRNTNAEVCFGHLELNGFKLSKHMVMDTGFDKKMFSKFKKVLSGHFHTRSNDDKIFYIGNPYEMFSDDIGDDRGFVIFDTDTYEIEYVNNPYSIYCKVYYTDDIELDSSFYCELEEYVDSKFLTLVVKNKKNYTKYQQFLDKLTTFNFNDLKIVETFDINFSDDVSQVDTSDTLSMLKMYVENIEESQYDISKIQNILAEVYNEVKVMV